MEAATHPGADAETQERLAKEAADADKGADLPSDEAGEQDGAKAEDVQPDPVYPKPELLGEGQLTLNVGGDKPRQSQIKMQGVSIEVPNNGEFKKGQFVDVVVRCRVAEVAIGDKFDNVTGTVTDTYRRHILKPLRVERVD